MSEKLINHYYIEFFLKSNVLLEMLKILYIIIKIIHYILEDILLEFM